MKLVEEWWDEKIEEITHKQNEDIEDCPNDITVTVGIIDPLNIIKDPHKKLEHSHD